MILSHHGQHEFGSPVLPMTKEAMLLSLIDNLDCKVVALNKALETTKEGEFTTKIFSLDNRSFYNPKKNLNKSNNLINKLDNLVNKLYY